METIKKVITPKMARARAKLKGMPDSYFNDAPNRDKRREIVKLMKMAGYGDLVRGQIDIWDRKLKTRKK